MSADGERIVFTGTFFQADKNGDYVNMGRSYKIQIDGYSILLSNERIPLLNIQSVKRVGNGIVLVFLDANHVAKEAMLTTSNLFGIAFGRDRKLNNFMECLNKSVQDARSVAPADQVKNAQMVAAPDTCHDCGASGGAQMTFGHIYGMLTVTRWSTSTGVYCKEHATKRGVRALIISGLLGWWSLVGVLKTSGFILLNARALMDHSNIPRAQIVVMRIVAFVPALILVSIIVWYVVKK